MPDTKTILIAGGMLGIIGLVVFFTLRSDAKAAAGAVVEVLQSDKVNPYSADNAIYQNVIGGAGRAITGDPGFSLGGWLYDITHATP